MENVEKIIKDTTLTYEQKVLGLAKEAENSIQVLNLSNRTEQLRKEGIICDLGEGAAPYRPRYIVPDYQKFLREGSTYLNVTPPTDIWECIHNLLILYKHVPSITSMPVFIGNLDELLDPFIEDELEARKAIKLFLTHIDRTITDSFCHANIGPADTLAGRLILELERELQNSTPNITLKYSEDTPKEFAYEAIQTSLAVAKPSFANHELFSSEFTKGEYGIASCYNGLYIGGGSYTLVRLNLAKLAETALDLDHFLTVKLPEAMDEMAAYMDERIRYIVEESTFFETNFLIREGLISRDRFTAMFGLVGLAECVNTLLHATEPSDRFGHSSVADQVGVQIIEQMDRFTQQHKNPYCQISDGHFLLHAQVGLGDDQGVSPGCRIPIGEEPTLWNHLKHSSLFHKYFPSGIGDIFPFENNATNNPEYLLNIIEGAFKEGMRYFSCYSSDSDVIRITGYLVKKSDIEKLERGETVIHDTVALGKGAKENAKILERKVR